MLITPTESQSLRHLMNAVGDTLTEKGKMCLESGYVLKVQRVNDETIRIEIKKEKEA